jgi:hypothetical protein
MSLDYTEWLGYAASIIVAISLTMSNIKRLRWINMIGAIAFTIYGIVLKLSPILIVNSFIVGINIYYLVSLSRTRDKFNLIPVAPQSSIFLPRFLDYYKKEISELFPDFDPENLGGNEVLFITRNVMPVGLIIFSKQSESVIQIHVDYAIPMYRDYETATYFFNKFSSLMQEKGYKKYISYCKVSVHQRYLRRMKFVKDDAEPNLFIRKM